MATRENARCSARRSMGRPMRWMSSPTRRYLRLRDHLHLTGTKFGCGQALCGACTGHVDGQAMRACATPAEAAVGTEVTTIEGIAGDEAKAVQTAWQRLDVVQCGYCQSGQIMTAVALLGGNPKPTDSDIDGAHRQHLSLRHLPPHPSRRPRGGPPGGLTHAGNQVRPARAGPPARLPDRCRRSRRRAHHRLPGAAQRGGRAGRGQPADGLCPHRPR